MINTLQMAKARVKCKSLVGLEIWEERFGNAESQMSMMRPKILATKITKKRLMT